MWNIDSQLEERDPALGSHCPVKVTLSIMVVNYLQVYYSLQFALAAPASNLSGGVRAHFCSQAVTITWWSEHCLERLCIAKLPTWPSETLSLCYGE